MAKITLEGFKCERCEHVWLPRVTTEDEPIICPRCKSPYWNKPRKVYSTKRRAVLAHFKKKKIEGK